MLCQSTASLNGSEGPEMTVFVHPGIEYLRLRVCICKGIRGEEHSVLSMFFYCFICLPKPSPLQNSRGWSTIQGSLLPQDFSQAHTQNTACGRACGTSPTRWTSVSTSLTSSCFWETGTRQEGGQSFVKLPGRSQGRAAEFLPALNLLL